MHNVILLHGALGSEHELIPLRQALNSAENTIHSFSFSGHAYSSLNQNFGIERFAQELKDFILEKKLNNVSVFGYSMGGYVALYLATKEKHLIKKIITLGTKFNWSKESVDKEIKLLNPETLLEKVPAFAKLLESKHGPGWKHLVIKTAGMMQEIGEKDFLNSDCLKTLSIPVLLGIADNDQMVTLDETVAVFKTLPNAAMYMLPKSKHQLESIDVALASNIILNFITRD